MSTTPEARIRKAFNRLVASADGKQIREKLLSAASTEDLQTAAELNRKAIGQLVTLAKRKGEFALATYLRTTRTVFEIQ